MASLPGSLTDTATAMRFMAGTLEDMPTQQQQQQQADVYLKALLILVGVLVIVSLVTF
jgi:hypothetical protein